VERPTIIEGYEFASTHSAASTSQEHLSLKRTNALAQAGKWSLKIAGTFSTSKRETYRFNLRRQFKREPLKLALHVRGKTDGATLIPVFTWYESNRRIEGRLAESSLSDLDDWTRLEFDLAPLKNSRRSEFRLEGFEIRESADSKKQKENSSFEIYLDEIEVVSQVPADLEWELELLTGQLTDAILAEPKDGIAIHVKVDFFSESQRKYLKLYWEIRDAGNELAASGDAQFNNIIGNYALHIIRFKTVNTTGPYVAAAFAYTGKKPETVHIRTFNVSDQKLEFKFTLPEKSNETKLATGFTQDVNGKQTLRAEYRYKGSGHPSVDYFSLFVPWETTIPSSRLRSVALRINIIDTDKGFNDSRAALIIKDATGLQLQLPEVSLIEFTGWKELRWDIPDWESSLVRFPITIEEIRFLETGRRSWANMSAGCQGALAIDYLKLTYDNFTPHRFSVANARTNKTQFSDLEALEGGAIQYRATNDTGHKDEHAFEISFKGAGGRYRLPLNQQTPGNPLSVSFWCKTDLEKLQLKPFFVHRGHWSVARKLTFAEQTVTIEDGWKLLEWFIPFNGMGITGSSAWQHVLVCPLNFKEIEVVVPAKTNGKLFIDDLSFLTQLPAEKRLDVSVTSGLKQAEGHSRLSVEAKAANVGLTPLEANLQYLLSDAEGKELLSQQIAVQLSAGQSTPLDFSKVDFAKAEGPFQFEIQEAGAEEGKGFHYKETVFVTNARVTLNDFDHLLFLKGGKQTEAAKKDGRYGVEITHNKGRIGRRNVTGFRRILPGYPKRLGLWVKGDKSGLALTILGHDRGPNVTNFSTTPIIVDWEGWRHVELDMPTGLFPTDTAPTTDDIDYPILVETLSLNGNAANEGNICIDNLSLLTELPRAELLDVGLDYSLPSRLVSVGEDLLAVVENRSLVSPVAITLKWQIRPSSGSSQGDKAGVIRVSLRPGERKSVALGVKALSIGPYVATWALSGKEGEPTVIHKEDFLCMKLASDRVGDFITDEYKLYAAGSVTTDTFVVEWNDIEKFPGEMNYDHYDDLVPKIAAACPNFIGRLGYTTFWSSPRAFYFKRYGFWEGDSYQYPLDLKAWYNYVYETVRRYKSKINYWEVWNEPAQAVEDIDMPIPKYLRLLQIASVAVRQANSDAKIIMGSLASTGMKTYLDKFLEAGGGQWIDIIGIHPVDGMLSPEISFLPERIKDAVDRIKKDNPKLEVWVTSLVWPSSHGDLEAGLAEHVQAEFMARGKVLCLASGAAKVLDHRLTIDKMRKSSSTIYQIRPTNIIPSPNPLPPLPNWFLKPSFLSLKIVNEVLEGARFREEVSIADRSRLLSRCYLFEKGNEVLVVMWRRRGKSTLHLSSVAQPLRGFDTYGNDLDLTKGKVHLSGAPVYLYFKASEADKLMQSLPFAKIDYQDHPDSQWKQNLLATATANSGLTEFNLSGLGRNDLVILRQVDLTKTKKKISVRIDGKKVMGFDTSPLARFEKHSKKRFADITLMVPNARLKGKSKVKIDFTDDEDKPATPTQTRFYTKKPGPLYLSDIDFAAAQQSQSILREDENVVGQPIRIQNRVFSKGIGTHAKSQIVYFLGGQFGKFKTHPGLDQSVEEGSVTFQVIADGKTLYESDAVTPYSKTEPLDLDITACQVLELRVGSNADGIAGDWACWGNARVE